jgi:sarcosine oxidase subunit gamma
MENEAAGMSYQRISPVPPRPTARSVTTDGIVLTDLSRLPKCGFKGPGAPQWLTQLGLPLPQRPNAWLPLEGGGIVARLGRTEFFLEDGADGQAVARATAAFSGGAADVYPVIRQDAGLLLAGNRCHELLAQTCNVNFAGLDPAQREAVMTQMVGVAVLAVHAGPDPSAGYRIWCDPTYAPYLWETLSDVAADLDNVSDEAHRAPQ